MNLYVYLRGNMILGIHFQDIWAKRYFMGIYDLPRILQGKYDIGSIYFNLSLVDTYSMGRDPSGLKLILHLVLIIKNNF